MKKFLSFLVLVPLLLAGCSQVNDEPRYEGDPTKGALVIRGAGVSDNLDLIGTRAEADVNIFTLIVQDEGDPANKVTGIFSSFDGGKVDNLKPADYTVTLTSHPDGFTPAFGDAWYEAVETGVNVTAATNTSITMEAVQANAGVYFVYHPSLEAIGEVVPQIVQNTSTLIYEGENKEAIGYFNPEEAVLTVVKAGGGNLTIQGEEFQNLNLSSEQLWEITLRVGEEPVNGSITIVATVKVITEPNVFETFILGEVEEEEDMVKVIPPTKEDGTLAATTAIFTMIGEDITAARYGLFRKAQLDDVLESSGYTLEYLMSFNGSAMSAAWLLDLNTPAGLTVRFTGLTAGENYSFVIMPTKNGQQKAYRYEIQTIVPRGDLTTGEYSISVVGNDAEFDFAETYMNNIALQLVGDNQYYVGDTDFSSYQVCLFELPHMYAAYYTPETRELTFTGYESRGYYVLNEISWTLNYEACYGAVVMLDGDGEMMEPHVWLVDDNKLLQPKGNLYLWAYDIETEESLGWVERIAEGAVFTYNDGASKANIKVKQAKMIEKGTKKSAPYTDTVMNFSR